MNFISEIFGYPLGYIMKGCFFLTNNYVVSLILFTIAVKILMFPFALKQQKSTAQMAAFKPKLDEIQKKFANDKNRQSQEMMKLYEEYGYNPSSGCLTMLIQFPILFGLINVIYNPITHLVSHFSDDVLNAATTVAKEILGSGFSSVSSQISIITAVKQNPGAFDMFTKGEIAKIQEINMSRWGIDLSVVPQLALNLLILIPILSGVSMVLSSWASMKFSGTGDMQNGAMKGTMYGMSAFSVIFTFSVPAGVGVYWIFSNLLTIVQSWILKKFYDPKKLAAEYEAKIKAINESKKKKVKVVVKQKDGSEKVIEKAVSEKEENRIRLAKARELDDAKYGDEVDLPTFEDRYDIVDEKETKDSAQ